MGQYTQKNGTKFKQKKAGTLRAIINNKVFIKKSIIKYNNIYFILTNTSIFTLLVICFIFFMSYKATIF